MIAMTLLGPLLTLACTCNPLSLCLLLMIYDLCFLIFLSRRSSIKVQFVKSSVNVRFNLLTLCLGFYAHCSIRRNVSSPWHGIGWCCHPPSSTETESVQDFSHHSACLLKVYKSYILLRPKDSSWMLTSALACLWKQWKVWGNKAASRKDARLLLHNSRCQLTRGNSQNLMSTRSYCLMAGSTVYSPLHPNPVSKAKGGNDAPETAGRTWL